MAVVKKAVEDIKPAQQQQQQPQAAEPDDDDVTPFYAPNTYGFVKGIHYAARIASGTDDVKAIRRHLDALEADAQALLDAIERAEKATTARIEAGP